MYKVLKVVSYDMAGGASQEVHFNISVKQRVTRDVLKTHYDTGDRYIPGKTVLYLMTCRGQVISNTDPTPHVNTFANTSLGIVHVSKVKLSGVKNSASSLNTNRGSYQIMTGNTVTDEKFMNVLDGIQTVLSAA